MNFLTTNNFDSCLLVHGAANSQTGIVAAELLTDENGAPQDIRILAVNEALGEHTGLSVHELPGKQLLKDTPLLQQDPDLLHQIAFRVTNNLTERFQFDCAPLKRSFNINFITLPVPNLFYLEVDNITAAPNSPGAHLQQTNQLLSRALDSVADIISILRPDKTIVDLNRAGLDHYRLQTPLPKNIKCYEINSFDHACKNCPLVHAQQTELPVKVESFSNINGHFYECTATPMFTQDGTIGYFIVQQRDIQLQKQTQAVLYEAKKRAEASEQLKTEFLANVSHELRTPLNAILGFCQILEDETLDEEQQQMLNYIAEGGETLKKQIDILLTHTKLTRHELKPHFEVTNLYEIVQQVVTLLTECLKDKPVTILFDWSPDVPVLVETDYDLLLQILMQIGENAVKFTAEGIINMRVDLISRKADTACIQFTVKDTGIGVHSLQDRDILTPFVQGDGSATRKHGGLGLGLSIASNLTKLLDGIVEFDKDATDGASFSVTLPMEVVN